MRKGYSDNGDNSRTEGVPLELDCEGTDLTMSLS